MPRLMLMAVCVIAVALPVKAQPFTYIPTGFVQAENYSADWGDIDGDGDFDLFLSTANLPADSPLPDGRVMYENKGGLIFEAVPQVGGGRGATRLQDFDGDGDLDAFDTAFIFENTDGRTFDEIANFSSGNYEWGDADGDGDLDLTSIRTQMVQTSPGVWQKRFTDWDGGAGSLDSKCYMHLMDYDYDGDLDVMRYCQESTSLPTPAIFAQTAPDEFEFIHEFEYETQYIQTMLPDDFDGDGDIDILISNGLGDGATVDIHMATPAGYEVQKLDFPTTKAIASGDLDLDGDVDIAAVVADDDQGVLYVLEGDGTGSFEISSTPLNLSVGLIRALAILDLDEDGDLDLVLSERSDNGEHQRVLRNDVVGFNTPPATPSGLSVSANESEIVLSWTRATDNESATSDLTYGIRVGSAPGLADIVSPQSNLITGKPLVNRNLHAWPANQRVLQTLPAGTYYWAVQAYDPAGYASPFSAEASFVSVGPPQPLFEKTHTIASGGLTGQGALWGDVDGDGDLDILLKDGDFGETLYLDNGDHAYELAPFQMEGGNEGWQDADNDGDPDAFGKTNILLNNKAASFIPLIDNATRLERDQGFNGCSGGADYDMDGDLDWFSESENTFGVHRNAGNMAFNRVIVHEQTFPLLSSFIDCLWYDYDADGDPDLLIGDLYNDVKNTRFYRNDGPTSFVLTDVLDNYAMQVADAGDFDADGDSDLLMVGYDPVLRVSEVRLIRNDRNGVLVDVSDQLPVLPERPQRIGWIDYDNDGDLDFYLLTDNGAPIFQNEAGLFSQTTDVLVEAFEYGYVDAADYDHDGDLDILFSGRDVFGNTGTTIYTNNTPNINTPPTTPLGLNAQVDGANVTFIWSAATDDTTPVSVLTYQLRVGTAPGKEDVLASGYTAGFRQVSAPGNAGAGTTWTLHDLPNGTYYWSVQAVDAVFAASPFALEGSFLIDNSPRFDFIAKHPDLVARDLMAAAAWGDYDADGDYDVMVVLEEDRKRSARLFRNEGDFNFADQALEFPFAEVENVAWGDPDNDGDLDLAFTVPVVAGRTYDLHLLRNNQGELAYDGLLAAEMGGEQPMWADIDNDGDQDFISDLDAWLRNRNGTFTRFELSGISRAPDNPGNWVDVDLDGDFDYFSNGILVENSYGFFFDPLVDFDNRNEGFWADFNGDGFADLITRSLFYRSDAGLPDPTLGVSMPPNVPGSLIVGDLDNDGNTDALSVRQLNDGNGARYTYEAGAFYDTHLGIRNAHSASNPSNEHALLDLNRDGLLDLSVDHTDYGFIFYQGRGGVVNSPPTPPQGLTTTSDRGVVTFTWQGATDQQSATPLLRYNLRVGTTPGGAEIMSPMVHEDSNQLLIPGRTNAGTAPTWKLWPLPNGTYYWSVQAVDNGQLASGFAPEQTFTISDAEVARLIPVETSLPPASRFSARMMIAPQDVDKDGDLDLAYAYTDKENSRQRFDIQTQDTGSFSFTAQLNPSSIPHFRRAQWGDYDNDGDPDLLATAITDIYNPVLYVNNLDLGFEGIDVASDSFETAYFAWGDLDQDGDLDIAGIRGARRTVETSDVFLFRNQGAGGFERDSLTLPDVAHCSLLPYDFDNDGDLDLLAGSLKDGTSDCVVAPTLYVQEGGVFERVSVTERVALDEIRPGDYDADGDADLLMITYDTADGRSLTQVEVFQNQGNAVFEPAFKHPLKNDGHNRDLSWIDLNNDGLLDIFTSSRDYSIGLLNTGTGVFVDMDLDTPPAANGAHAVGDVDGDGDQDLLLPHYPVAAEGFLTFLYENTAFPNHAPGTPLNLANTFAPADTVWFSWEPPEDDKTPAAGLTYHLRVGTTPGGDEVFSGASRAYGVNGNVGSNLRWPLVIRDQRKPYYWSVQAVDASFAFSVPAAGTLFTEFVSSENGPEGLPDAFELSSQYPNPANRTLNLMLNLPEAAALKVSVYDVLGRRVLDVQSDMLQPGWKQTLPLNVAGLAAGTYLYKIQRGQMGELLNGRFIVAR